MRKAEKKLEELEKRISQLELKQCNHHCIHVSNPPVVQQRSYCRWCYNPMPCGQTHFTTQ